jgi:hypothetical protein
MNKVFLLLGVSLFIIGSVLLLGAYVFFNQYSVSDSHDFHYIGETWQSPETPLELGEGDKVTVKTSKVGNMDGNLYIISTSGKRVRLSDHISSSVYYVQASGFYYFLIDIDMWGAGSEPCPVTIEITVASKTPNLFFLLIGVIVLLAGAGAISVAFLYKSKKKKNSLRV